MCHSYSKPKVGRFLTHGVDTLGYIAAVEGLGISSTTFTQFAPEATEFDENKGHYTVQAHSRSPILAFWYQSKAHIQLPISD